MENSKIEWTHHTFNPWWGCTKVSAGCKNCYAEKQDARFGESHWGDNADRKFMGEAHWRKPIVWNEKAAKAGERHRVFCSSMSDVLEKRQDDKLQNSARERLFGLIAATPHLDWLILTKRPENFDMLPHLDNIWLGVSAENQEQADIRIPLLLEQKWAAVRFVSYEPALGPLEIRYFLGVTGRSFYPHKYTMKKNHGLDWIICGAESGPGRREMDPSWPRRIEVECYLGDIPFFFKQSFEGGKKVSLPMLRGITHNAFPRVKRKSDEE